MVAADSWDDRRHLDIPVAIVEPAGKFEQPRRAAEDLDANVGVARLVATRSTYDPVDR
jgi:hypothetical protein